MPLDNSFPTLAEMLGQKGYATAGFVGNIYYCNALYGIGRGFSHYEDAYENQTVSLFETIWSGSLGKRIARLLGYSVQLDDGVALRRKTAAMLNRDVLGWLDRRPVDRPFFAFINYYDVHRPFVFNDSPDLRFGMAALPDATQLEIDKRFLDLSAGKPAPSELAAQQIVGDAYTLYHDSYDSCIATVDRQLGVLLDELERRGTLKNTLVIVTSDHGEQLGERGLVGHGISVYRTEVHVPLVVVPPSPSSTSGILVDQPVSIREIAATVAEYVDLGERSLFPGRSLTRFLNAGVQPPSDSLPVLSELQHNVSFPPGKPIPTPFGEARSLVSHDRVYIRRADGSEELYDLVNDPMERFDLAKFPESELVIEQFREALGQLRPSIGGQGG